MTETEKIEYPVRINKYLLLKQYCSRREADRCIERSEVNINGTPAVLGQKVKEGDIVTLTNHIKNKKYKYFLFNKPRGIVSVNPQGDEQGVEDISGLGSDVSPVGMLDKESEGLMLLTNDGRIVDAILNPKYAHEREYEVRVDKYIKERDLKKLSEGVDIEGYMTKPAKASRLGDDIFSLTLTQGKKHQIRRMCVALGYQVTQLKRIRMMDLSLDIDSGEKRTLTPKEIKILLELAKITTESPHL